VGAYGKSQLLTSLQVISTVNCDKLNSRVLQLQLLLQVAVDVARVLGVAAAVAAAAAVT